MSDTYSSCALSRWVVFVCFLSDWDWNLFKRYISTNKRRANAPLTVGIGRFSNVDDYFGRIPTDQLVHFTSDMCFFLFLFFFLVSQPTRSSVGTTNWGFQGAFPFFLLCFKDNILPTLAGWLVRLEAKRFCCICVFFLDSLFFQPTCFLVCAIVMCVLIAN